MLKVTREVNLHRLLEMENVNRTDESVDWQGTESLLATSSLVTKIISPVQLILATFGNTMIIATFCLMKDPPTLSAYFCALAISDLLFLYFALGLYQWASVQLDFYFFLLHDITCKLNSFFIYACGAMSSWLLVAMTVQRAMCVVWPHVVNAYCTHKTSRLIVAIIVILISALYSHIFYGITLFPAVNNSTSLYMLCASSTKVYEEFFQKTWVMADAIISSFAPFAILLISNTVLFRTVLMSVKTARQRLATGQSAQVSVRKKKAESLTVTLISLSLTFLVLTAPNRIFYMFFGDMMKSPDAALAVALARYFNMLYHMNSVVTFYLYCLSGTKFRAQVLDILSCGLTGAGRDAKLQSKSTGVVTTVSAV